MYIAKPKLYIFGGWIIAIFLLALWLIPQFQTNNYLQKFSEEDINKLESKDRIQLMKNAADIENSTRITIAQIIGGLALLGGLYFTYQNVRTAQENLRVTEEGKLTERFSKAVEMLGNEKLDVRLGGIYALERIAKDSLEHHWTVIEVLSAFVRESSKISINKKKVNTLNRFVKPREDIQAVMTIIGRRKWIESETNFINLQGADLTGCNLMSGNLNRVDLSESNLTNTFLGYTTLQKANLRGANLTDAFLVGTNLTDADLAEANLEVDLFFAISMYGANIPDNYPHKLGDLTVRRMSLGVDHKPSPDRIVENLKLWHKRFREKQE